MTNTPVKIYRDIDFNFTKAFNGDVLVLENENAVRQSVTNIILTIHHEKVFNPFFGSNIRKNLFELNHPTLAFEVENLIREALVNYEPRIRDINIAASTFEHSINVNVKFKIISINKEVSVDIELERLR